MVHEDESHVLHAKEEQTLIPEFPTAKRKTQHSISVGAPIEGMSVEGSMTWPQLGPRGQPVGKPPVVRTWRDLPNMEIFHIR